VILSAAEKRHAAQMSSQELPSRGRRLAAIGIGIAILALLIVSASGGNLLFHIKTYLIPYAVSFALMIAGFFLLRNFGRFEFRLVLLFAVLFRIAMICAPPTLSDDIYRYVWDGKLSAHGINPYLYRPDAPELVSFRDKAIFGNMSSGIVYSVYPPVSQAVFLLGALTPYPIKAIKIIYSLFDIGTIIVLWLLLSHMGLPKRNIILYAWNPLPIYEFAGSGHTDSALLFFTLLTLLLFARQKYFGSFTALGLAIISKLLPLVFLPFLFFAVPGRRKYWLAAWSGVVVVLGYLPFIGALPKVVKNFTTDVGMYLSSLYIFNGSLFTLWYWARDTFQIYKGYTDFHFMTQTLSFLFGFIWLGLVLSAFLKREKTNEREIMWRFLLTFFAFLICSPNVQVWYISWIACLVPLIVNLDRLSRRSGLTEILARTRLSWLTWSFTAAFAYIAYYRLFSHTGTYSVPVWAIWLEYGVLFGLLFIEMSWQLRHQRQRSSIIARDTEPSWHPTSTIHT